MISFWKGGTHSLAFNLRGHVKKKGVKLQFLLLSATGITAFRKSFCSLRYQSRTWLCIFSQEFAKKKKFIACTIIYYVIFFFRFKMIKIQNSKERKIAVVHYIQRSINRYNRIIIGAESLIKVVQSKVSQ